MAFGHGKNTRVYINGYDLTGFFRQYDSDLVREVADSSVFNVNDKTYLPGKRDATVSLEGLYDGAAGAVDEVLHTALSQDPSLLVVCPQGDANGNVAHGIDGRLSDYGIQSPLDDIVAISDELQSVVGRDRLIVQHAMGTEVATGNGPAQDGGAQSANGGVGYLQVPDITGITNLAVVIQDSADGSTGWVTILTFAGVTADRAKERVAISGTVRRYTRASWTFTGAGSAQFFVGFGRK